MDTMKIDMFIGQSNSKGQIEGEIQLPMEKNDIEKICNVSCTLNVREKSVENDVIQVSGEAEFCIYYLTNQNVIDSFSAVSDFVHDIEAKGAKPEHDINILSRIEDTVASMVDARTVKASATVCFIANVCESTSMPDLDTDGLETRRSEVDSKCKEKTVCHPFHVSSDLRIQGGMEQIETVVGTRCYGVINGTKKDGENVICFGDMFLNTIYCSNNGIWQIFDSFPFEETIDCGMNIENKEIIPTLCVKKACANAYDPDVISYSVSAIIKLEIMTGMPCGVVVDAYSLTHDINATKAHINMKSPVESQGSKYTFRSTAKTEGIQKPVCIIATPVIKSEYAMEGSVNIEGSIICDIIHQKEDETIEYTKVTLPMDENIPAPSIKENHDIWTSINVQKASAIISGDEMEIRCPMDVMVCAYSAEECDVIQNVEQKDELKRDESSIMIYFKDEDEDIFDIAKKYHIAGSDINTDNDKKLILMNPYCKDKCANS